MFEGRINRRGLLAAASLSLLAACTVVPKATAPVAPPPEPEAPVSTLPTDTDRHRIALLVPLSGPNAAVGQSIANAATMALLDTNAANLRITTYDTGTNPADAAKRAVQDGNKLILGPLMSGDIAAVVSVARPAKVPLISYSNDETAAARDVYVMGNLPGQSVRRTVEYARSRGVNTFAALVPRGEYGERASSAFMDAVRAGGGKVLEMEAYDRSSASVTAAAKRLQAKGGFDAVLIADGGSLSAKGAAQVRAGAAKPRILGTELWSGEKEITASPALNGAWFASVSDGRFAQFAKSYRTRFGTQPFRIATLGYDSVLLTLRVARNWKPGKEFPGSVMLDEGGFLGLDGAFRFNRSGVVERALEVRQVSGWTIEVVSPAATRFVD